jgi:hypothetical protein
MHSIYKETTNMLQFTTKREKPNLSPAHPEAGIAADSVSRRSSHVLAGYSTNSTTAVMFQSKRSSWLSGLTTTL